MIDMTSLSSSRAALLGCLLSFARGLVLVMVLVLPMVMLKRLGQSNSWASLDTALLLLPFVLRGVLRPVAEKWICRWLPLVLLQFLMVVSLWGVSRNISTDMGVGLWLWLAVFSLAGAVHDIVAAGMTALWCDDWKRQRRIQLCFVFGMLAAVLGMGVSMVLAGDMEVLSRRLNEAWHSAFLFLAAMMAVVEVVVLCILPRSDKNTEPVNWHQAWNDKIHAHAHWWTRKNQWQMALAVILLSLHQWLLWRGTLLFLIDPGSIGGLSLGPQGIGFAQGTIGALALMAGLVLGVGAIKKDGLGHWLWPMVLAMTLPDVILLYLSYEMPSELLTVSGCLLVENLFNGFGMAGILFFLFREIIVGDEEVHADTCMALLALSAMIAGIAAGILVDLLGYRRFFLIVVVASLMAVLTMVWLVRRNKEEKTNTL
jgi:PAT family beta-lactamase induction signal transducer AmpG